MNTKRSTMVLTFCLAAGTLLAQAPQTRALLMALSTNSKQVIAYQWKQKTTIARKGSPAGFKIDEIRFDAMGQPQRLTLLQPEARHMGPLRAHKAAEVKSAVEDVMRLAARYANPQEVALAIQKGEIWEGQGGLRIHSRAVLLPIDDMTILASSRNYLPFRMECRTRYEGSPVTITVDYQQLPNGPNMMMHMNVQIPAEQVVVDVESFDFMRLAGSIAP